MVGDISYWWSFCLKDCGNDGGGGGGLFTGNGLFVVGASGGLLFDGGKSYWNVDRSKIRKNIWV